MLTAPTLEQLHALKLGTLAAAWTEQQGQPDLIALSFDERFALLVEAEWRARENKRFTRALQEAKLKLPQACIEAIDYPARRELDKALVRQLATCRWVEEHQNLLVVGATGTGKTFVGCAFAHQACRKGFRALYRRASRLFHELTLARADGTYLRLLTKLARVDVLLIDDWGLDALTAQDRRDFLELLDDRHGTRSTILTSQLPVAQWHDFIGDPTLADSICDRLLHNGSPSRAKRSITQKGGQARGLTAQRRFAPFTMTDPGVHDGAISVFTMAGIRSLHPNLAKGSRNEHQENDQPFREPPGP